MRTEPRPLPVRGLLPWLPAILAACAATGPGPAPDQPPPPVPAFREALPPGTVIRIAETELTVPGSGPPAAVLDGLLREALRLSPQLDFGAGRESPGSGVASRVLRPRLDPQAQTLSLTLDRDDVPLPITAERFADDATLIRAVDRLAWAARLALGESIDEPPPSVATIYSASVDCILATERALEDEARGMRGLIDDRLTTALRADPACTVTATVAVTAALASGMPREAERIAVRSLTTYRHRLSETSRHRLARALLLARAEIAGPGAARRFDQDLLALARTFRTERPHDPHGTFSDGLAQAYLGDFAAAADRLRPLTSRWPEVPQAGYFLAIAELALGRPEAALDQLDRIDRMLPQARTLWPRALGLLAAGHHDELDDLLARVLRSEPAESPLRHEVRRMRAAHAILRGDPDRGAAELLADLEWIRTRPSQLERYADHLAELGESLVELGFAPALELRLAAIDPPPGDYPQFRATLTFLTGLAAAVRDAGAPEVEIAIRRLGQGDHHAYASRLRAAVHGQRGELDREVAEIATTLRVSARPLWRAAFIRALRQLGDRELLEPMVADTRAELSRFDLRQPASQPLAGPGRALAWIATTSP